MPRSIALPALTADHRVLAVMLLLLHLAISWDFGSTLSRSLMLAHFGLFIIWQPFWSHSQRIDKKSMALFVFAAALYLFWFGWALVTFWTLMLIGLVAGRASVSRSQRYVYLLALAFLVAEVLVGCMPSVFKVHALSSQFRLLFRYGLIALALIILLIPIRRERADAVRSVDFLYGLLMTLLTVVVALGALLRVLLSDVQFPAAVAQVTLMSAAFMFIVSWLWMPVGGFSGLGQLWERYLQNIGTPFESWLAQLARLSRSNQTADQFLQSALAQLIEIPWIAGVTWTLAGANGVKGKVTPHSFRARQGDLTLVGYAARPMGTALLVHAKLLLQLITHFHRSKLREQELSQRAHLQAIYETGARVTHDIKNLLQSLYTMTAALERSDGDDNAELQELLRRQLPHLTQRLHLALEKLQTPDTRTLRERQLSDWWDALKTRNAGRHIEFSGNLTVDPLIPEDLFDSVAENLLENARTKRMNEPDIAIEATLDATPETGVSLKVSDTGSPLDPSIASNLFKGPVNSEHGLGIGLYQAARQAESLGYSLSLGETNGAAVSFILRQSQQLAQPNAALSDP